MRIALRPVAGMLEVGRTPDTHEVTINHADLKPDENGVGHIIFSPSQARYLANLLIKQADHAEAEAKGMHPNADITGGG
jgi:hypothetical protein